MEYAPLHLNTLMERSEGWSLALRGLEESPSCIEHGCPVKAGEARFIALTVQIGTLLERESNRDQTAGFWVGGVKRAILPAAISDSTACRLLAKVGSREPS